MPIWLVPSSKTWTVPVGVPAVDVKVAVSVTVWPSVAGLGLTVNCGVVVAGG